MQARLGSVELEGTWRATYILVHRARGDFVSLSLFDPEGALRLERQLPVQAGSCATLSGVIALVLERFFLRPEQLEPPEPAPTVAASSPPEPVGSRALESPAAAKPESAPPPSTTPDAPAVPAAPRPRRFHAGAGLWVTNSWLAPSLSLDGEPSTNLRLGINAGFDLNDHQVSVFEGSAFARRMPLSLWAGSQLRLGDTVSATAGLELLGVLEAARTQALAESGNGFRVVPGVGARLGAHFLPAVAAEPFLELTAAWLLGKLAPAFQVGEREVLAPPSLVLGLAFGIRTPL